MIDLAVPFHTAVTTAQVRDAFAEHPEIDFVSLVHAEAATGNTNPVAEIGEVVRAHGALFYLDAVASIGAEPVLPDAWGVDLCVIGAQKAMGGPAGVSAVSVSERAWARMAARIPGRLVGPTSPCWTGRSGGSTASTAHAARATQLEMLALEACVERIEAEGLDAVMRRHALAAAATRAGAVALGGGLEPYVYEAGDAAPVATTLRAPSGSMRGCWSRGRSPRICMPLVAGGGALAKEMNPGEPLRPRCDAGSRALLPRGAGGGAGRVRPHDRPESGTPRNDEGLGLAPNWGSTPDPGECIGCGRWGPVARPAPLGRGCAPHLPGPRAIRLAEGWGAAPPSAERGRARPSPPARSEYHRVRGGALACPPVAEGAAFATPSKLTLLGLVQHLAEVERNGFQRVFGDSGLPPVYAEETGTHSSRNAGSAWSALGLRAHDDEEYARRRRPRGHRAQGNRRAYRGLIMRQLTRRSPRLFLH